MIPQLRGNIRGQGWPYGSQNRVLLVEREGRWTPTSSSGIQWQPVGQGSNHGDIQSAGIAMISESMNRFYIQRSRTSVSKNGFTPDTVELNFTTRAGDGLSTADVIWDIWQGSKKEIRKRKSRERGVSDITVRPKDIRVITRREFMLPMRNSIKNQRETLSKAWDKPRLTLTVLF
ncbi:hypothetical protein B0H10DRAFT_1954181 [Mycena sp. CBHHK59/15]|nr:hypothetical protein B0H10DRAFT_1954181 [Mycena sp. CBHHK59/15]